jgi:hypothetical protein
MTLPKNYTVTDGRGRVVNFTETEKTIPDPVLHDTDSGFALAAKIEALDHRRPEAIEIEFVRGSVPVSMSGEYRLLTIDELLAMGATAV